MSLGGTAEAVPYDRPLRGGVLASSGMKKPPRPEGAAGAGVRSEPHDLQESVRVNRATYRESM